MGENLRDIPAEIKSEASLLLMEFPTISHDQAFVDFCNRNGLPVTKTPASTEEMGLAMEVLMKEEDPKLFQNLVKPDPNSLPADLKLRRMSGNYWVGDEVELERCGFVADAAVLRTQIEQANLVILDQKIAASAARNKQREQAQLNDTRTGWEKMMTNSPSPESVMQARQTWGITGEPIF